MDTMAHTLEALVARCQADCTSHMTGGPCREGELRCVEEALGCPLPGAFRLFLSRLGGGVFYLQHEVFGAHRVMIHDIELVPDLLSFRTWVGTRVPPRLLPIHRSGERIHAIDLDGGLSAAVVPLSGGGPGYSDFASFLGSVIVP
jgi:hypothetical protein